MEKSVSGNQRHDVASPRRDGASLSYTHGRLANPGLPWKDSKLYLIRVNYQNIPRNCFKYLKIYQFLI